jgi:flavin-dependent dehydrogenase
VSPTPLIVGGGPAGAALAVLLARAGRPVTLVERDPGPRHKVCGEFISGEAAAYLLDLGLDLQALGAVPILKVRLAARGPAAEAPLPFAAFSLSRRRLDEALLQHAAACGAVVRRGCKVRALTPCEGGWRAAVHGGAELQAGAVFLATGKHDLKGFRRPQGLHRGLVGFKMHWRLAPAQAAALVEAVELHLFPGGYAGLEPIEEGLANLCLVVGKGALGGGVAWPGVLQSLTTACPGLASRLRGAAPLWARPLAIAAIPYGHVGSANDGLWRLGDQFAVIPSFAGDGIGIALHSAQAAAGAWLAGEDAPAFNRALKADLGARVRGSALLSRLLVQGWAQPLAAGLTRLRPQLLSAAAVRTRIPEKALLRVLPRERASCHEVTEGAFRGDTACPLHPVQGSPSPASGGGREV